MFKILKAGHTAPYESHLFPGGEVGVRLKVEPFIWRALKADHQTIVARINDSNDVMRLVMLTDALRRIDPTPIRLFMPYVPYARQDRVCNLGESHSLKAFANLVNSLGFERVIVVDPHSDVVGAVFERLDIVTQLDVVNAFDAFISSVMASRATFVAPDAGGNKKTSALASYFNHSDFIRADKLRDLTNGNIKETIVYADDLSGRDVVIADDLCDGGRTFIELAKVLKTKGARKVILYVTHGIFSKGTDPLFKNGIDEIYTTDSFTDFPANLHGATVLEMEQAFKHHL